VGPPPRPWYKKWWVWTLVVTGVAAAVALGAGLGTRDTGEASSTWKWDLRGIRP
jgi:hypothetical protein